MNKVKGSIFTTSPERFNLDRKINGIKKVAPSLKVLLAIDKVNNSDIYNSIITSVILSGHNNTIVKQVLSSNKAVYLSAKLDK